MRRQRAGTLHLVVVKAHAERQVVRRLREEGISAYAPRYLEYVAGEATEFQLFPGYVFVWVTDQWAKVRSTVGVHDFLMNGDKQPARVEQSIVDELRERETPYGYVRLYPKFEVGAPVRLGDSVGVCLGMSPRERVRVLIQMLGREVEVSIPARDLVAV